MKRFFNLLVCLCICINLSAEVKYVFYFIGDGMGPNQVLATEMYFAELDSVIGRQQLNMTQFPYSGQAATFSKSNGITDSAAAGTALATGSKTNNGTLGLNAEGDTLTSIAEQLKAQGWGVGLLTTVAIDHATPAAFYANVKKRDDYYQIGTQLAYTDFDFFGGAGFHRPIPRHNEEAKNLYDLAEEHGYTIASGLTAAEQKSAEARKMILVQATDAINRYREGSNFPYCVDGRTDSSRLDMLTDFAIRFLQQRNDRFFLMVEGGMIDYACHSRDGAAAIAETKDFDDAIGVALDFYRQHPNETLIVVTADHETGGMALGNSKYVLDLKQLKHQHCSEWALSDAMTHLFRKDHKPKWQEAREVLEKKLDFYGDVQLTDEEDAKLQRMFRQTLKSKNKRAIRTMYKEVNALADEALAMLDRKAKLGWTTYGHSAAAVPIFAIGQGAESFTGWHDNTEIAPLMLKAIGK